MWGVCYYYNQLLQSFTQSMEVHAIHMYVDAVGGVECVYKVLKVKDLPKLHRNVWNGNLTKVQSITNGMQKAALNSYDKNKRYVLLTETHDIYYPLKKHMVLEVCITH